MTMILNIETTHDVCSISVAENGMIKSFKESDNDKSHATYVTVLIDQALKDCGLTLHDMDAIAVSKGPGSYTGLRIGVAAAKGICYAIDLPLIGVHTLQSMVAGLVGSKMDIDITNESNMLYCPMIDARRMEVYCAMLSNNGMFISDVEAKIVDSNSFLHNLDSNKIVFFGSGSEKCRDVIKHPNAIFIDDFKVHANHLVSLSYQKYINKKFEDAAYFEPFYLKNFVATTPKKNILR